MGMEAIPGGQRGSLLTLARSLMEERGEARDMARSLFRPFRQAFFIVTCTAVNVTQVAGGHYGMAFFTGGLLSFVWWRNTRLAGMTADPLAGHAYAFGAACGTVFGMWIGRSIG